METKRKFRLTMERIAPDAAEDVRAVIRTAQWVLDEVDEDPEVIAQHTRGIGIINGWLDAVLNAQEGTMSDEPRCTCEWWLDEHERRNRMENPNCPRHGTPEPSVPDSTKEDTVSASKRGDHE